MKRSIAGVVWSLGIGGVSDFGRMFRRCDAGGGGRFGLKPTAARFKPWGNRRITMLALGIIFGFIAVIAVINFVEFGRVD